MPDPTLPQMARQMAARRLATQDGKKWLGLSQDERRHYLVSARGAVRPPDRQRAIHILAKKEAERAGQNWNDLTQEQRRMLMVDVRNRQKQTNE